LSITGVDQQSTEVAQSTFNNNEKLPADPSTQGKEKMLHLDAEEAQ